VLKDHLKESEGLMEKNDLTLEQRTKDHDGEKEEKKRLYNSFGNYALQIIHFSLNCF
jgi:hypothetical protein